MPDRMFFARIAVTGAARSDMLVQVRTALATRVWQVKVALRPATMASRHDSDQCSRRIAEHFHPERIMLFGSHARGTPTPDADVDLLVIMPRAGKSPHQQAAAIYFKCRSPFPVD